MGVYQKLVAIQSKLKAPKNQYNSFGKYKYRSCEDILEAVKPLCATHGAALVVGDEVVLVGERYYIKATATIIDMESGESVSNSAYAREEEIKKGMDGSQITGTASSYARKYCLNGLLAIDDTKDADTDENRNERENKELPKPIKQAQETFGGEVVEMPSVIVKDGVTQALVKGKYYPLTSFKLEQLNRMTNDKTYAACHDEARRLMEKMSK